MLPLIIFLSLLSLSSAQTKGLTNHITLTWENSYVSTDASKTPMPAGGQISNFILCGNYDSQSKDANCKISYKTEYDNKITRILDSSSTTGTAKHYSQTGSTSCMSFPNPISDWYKFYTGAINSDAIWEVSYNCSTVTSSVIPKDVNTNPGSDSDNVPREDVNTNPDSDSNNVIHEDVVTDNDSDSNILGIVVIIFVIVGAVIGFKLYQQKQAKAIQQDGSYNNTSHVVYVVNGVNNNPGYNPGYTGIHDPFAPTSQYGGSAGYGGNLGYVDPAAGYGGNPGYDGNQRPY